MENLILSFNIIAPLIVYMLLGAFLKKTRIITGEFRNTLNKLIVRLFIPCSIFKSLYSADFSTVDNWGFVFYTVLGNVLFFCVVAFISKRCIKDPALLGSFVQGATRGNGVIFGIPLCIAVFGEGSTLEMSLMLALLVPYYNTVVVGYLTVCGEKANVQKGIATGAKFSWNNVWKSLSTNAILYGVFIGLFFNLLKIPVPTFLMTPITQIGNCVSPLAFIGAGAAFNFKSARENGKLLSLAVAIKLLVLPGLFMILPILWGWKDHILLSCLCAFATPTAITSYPMAKTSGCDGPLAAEIVAFTTTLSMLSFFLWIFFFKQYGLL